MEPIKILDKKTMRKRQRKLFFERIKTKINQWLIKLQAKKVIEKIRKEYVRTGDAEIVLKSKKGISKVLTYLEEQQLITYEHSPTLARTNRYYIYINELVDERTKSA